MTKSPEAFRTISEVADVLDVPPHVLRFWETRFTQVKPSSAGAGGATIAPRMCACSAASGACSTTMA